jgi:hypothetical protein
MKNATKGIKKNYGESDGVGGYGYTGPGNSLGGLTGTGVLCLQLLGGTTSREYRGGVLGLSQWGFDWKSPRRGSFLYYMYYTTQAMFHHGREPWGMWNSQFAPELISSQMRVNKENSKYTDAAGLPQEVGWWRSPATREHNGQNPVMDTVLCALMLETYYRYVPMVVGAGMSSQSKSSVVSRIREEARARQGLERAEQHKQEFDRQAQESEITDALMQKELGRFK